MIRKLLSDENGKPSSTRLALVVCLFLFTFVTIVSVYRESDVPQAAYTTMHSVLLLCLGSNTVRATAKHVYEGDDDGIH